MFAKLPSCDGCVLKDIGRGFVYPEGSILSGVMLVGEAAGANEAMEGYPFRQYAPAGSILERALMQIGMSRDQFGIYNVIGCQPPSNLLVGEAYEVPAINHCVPRHLRMAYEHFGKPKVIVALGATATRTLTGLSGDKMGLDLLRGLPLAGNLDFLDPDTIVVPTYHPSYIVQGQHALMLVLMRDIKRAVDIAAMLRRGETPLTGKTYKPNYQLHVGPSEIRALTNWVKQNPNHPVSYDFEAVGSTTGDLNDEDLVNCEMDITQINVSLGPQHSMVWDYTTDTRGLTWDLLASTPNPKFGFNSYSFDDHVARWNGFEVRGSRIDDMMQAFHFLYSDIPGSKGGAETKSKSSQDDDGAFAPLQFCASWYDFPLAWKHLSKDDPHLYGGYDADSSYWVRNGTFADLQRFGIFESYDVYIRQLREELNMMERRGMPANVDKLKALSERLRREIIKAKHSIQEIVPDDLKQSKAIKIPTKGMKDLAQRIALTAIDNPSLDESFMHLQVPKPEDVVKVAPEQLPPAVQEFMRQVVGLREKNKEGKITSLGYRIESFDYYNQRCECLKKALGEPAAHCVICSGSGLQRGGAAKAAKCPVCAAPKGACEVCLGTGITAEEKKAKAKKTKKAKAKKEVENAEEQLALDLEDISAGVSVPCHHRWVVRDGGLGATETEATESVEEPQAADGSAVSGIHERRKSGRSVVVCEKCGAVGQKKKACSCIKRIIPDCARCGGKGKVKEYSDKVCKCRDRFIPNALCPDCYGSGLFTGRRTRWAKILPFNVKSSKQMMAYALARGYKIPQNSKRKLAMDKETIIKLAKSTNDPLFTATIKLRELDKIRSAYAEGWLKAAKTMKDISQWISPKELDRRLKAQQAPTVWTGRIGMAIDPDEKSAVEASVENLLEIAEQQLASNAYAEADESYMREYHRACARAGLRTVHTEFTTKPATGQLSSVRPNIQVAPNQSKYGELATEFREAIVAPPGYTVVECVAVGTRVLMYDLTWKRAEEIRAGERLWGFDEHPVTRPGAKRPGRYLRATQVVSTCVKPKPCYEIVTDQGTITVSADHSFAGRQTHYNRSGWIRAEELEPGMKIGFFTKPWDSDPSLNRSYLAGFFNGEGHVTSVSTFFSQNDGALANDVVERLNKEGFGVRKSKTSSNPKSKCKAYAITHSSAFAGVRFCGQVRPTRLLNKMIQNLEDTATWGKASKAATVISKRSVGVKDVVVMETDQHTLITEGFLSHNCDYRSFHVLTLGYEAQSADYIRLARLDPHSFVAANLLHLPGSKTCLELPDAELKAYLKEVKKRHETVRNKQAKPGILGYGFGMGAAKLYELNQEAFQNFEEAAGVIDMLNHLFPAVAQYRLDSPELAHRQRYLISKMGCIRWFMNVKTKDFASGQWKHGKDWEKAIAFRPANIAFCIIKLAKLRLKARGLTGKFGLVNNIHDAMLFICPNKYLEECLHVGKEEMERPVPQVTAPDGSPFWCETEAKLGSNWAAMEEYKYA